jgi:uncharacterized membrane protein/protein-disulfide isomerase
MSPQPTAATAPRTLWFAFFAAIGLIASSTSTWVHYRILNDPTYASFCDVNESFSCTVAYTSQFGSVIGVPVAVFGVVFFAFALLLIAMCARSSAAENLPGYLFAASTIGLAVVLYLGYASFFILKTLCVLCLATYVAVVGLFITAGTATRNPMTNLPSRAMRDLQLLFQTPSALGAMVLFLAAAVAGVMLLREPVTSAAELSPGEAPQAAAPMPTPTAAQMKQLEDYLAAQPRKPVMAPSDGAAIVILKFNDYQCPGCGQTYRDYKAVLAKWAKQAPGKVKFISKDYPLERECNQFVGQDLHPGACEAAVAVRLAREKGRAEAMEDWLFANQPAMNPDSVKKAAATVGGVTDFDTRYAATLELVKADIAQGQQLKIGGTPTFFVNGMQLPGLRAEFFDYAIAWELKRVTGGK